MAIQKIFLYPSPTLKTVSREVNLVEDAATLQTLISNMSDTVLAHGAAGLSAIQIGVPLRVAQVSALAMHGPALTLINPKIIGSTGELQLMDEGCLSVPYVKIKMQRYDAVLVRFLDTEGKEQIEKYKHLAAQCIQHELEHLDGKIFIDHFQGGDISKVQASVKKFWRLTFKEARKTYRMG